MKTTKHISHLLLLIITLLFMGIPTTSAAVGWVGNMFPAGGSSNTITAGNNFDVYVQVWKNNITPGSGQGSNINCTLHWGAVDFHGGTWLNATGTPMTYTGDVGNNDEYQATISPAAGLYEYTTYCTDTSDSTTYWQSSGDGRLTVTQPANIPDAFKALWVAEDTIAWNTTHGPSGVSYELHYDYNGNLTVPTTAGSGLPLTFNAYLNGSSYAKFPNINGYKALKISSGQLSQIPTILKSEVAIAVYDNSGNILETTGLQLQGVLDDLYTYNGDLGVIYSGSTPTLRVWAPTAQAVTLHRYTSATATTASTTPMTWNATNGTWSITGSTAWDKQYYVYEVQVVVPATGQVENNFVTDPYAVNLNMNASRSQIVDIYNDTSLEPANWHSFNKPALDAPEDIVVYEVHVRDFSLQDNTVAAAHRGKFKAFTYDGNNGRSLSNGMSHLIDLSQAGLTHIHLLPVFDIASVNEDESQRQEADPAVLATYAADSDQQQSIVGNLRADDGFNWGYDPQHYGAPEGSYATNQNDTSRLIEFREMVQILNENGLRVVMDVVYNHTAQSGQAEKSVLDKIVPGYYQRYDNQGSLQTSSCCADTASEFAMMEKLMVDTVVRWATAYKVDAFRFDLMNLHTVDNVIAVRDAVQSLTIANDGVDGSKIYVYGEGWDFGSASGKGLYHANQFNSAGTGVGTFNDRIRDAVHGGFDTDPLRIRQQGFINGLSYDWNGYTYNNRYLGDLLDATDRLRVGLAGNLQNYSFTDRYNNNQTGLGLSGTGYALDPQEAVNYISKHDNETLYDLNVFKAPIGTAMADRLRIQNMGLSLVGLGQGVPFFHLGSDMLRSKSLDRNSYDSGDWFNRIDFTYQANNFGVGLPPAWDNSSRWDIMRPLLTNTALQPNQSDILDTVEHFKEILEIRASSELFHLETASDVNNRLQFHNTGSSQLGGLIVMTLDDTISPDLDPNYEHIIVLFNANKVAYNFTLPSMAGLNASLHPVQANSNDSVVQTASFNSSTGTFSVPARTTAVFVSDGSSSTTDIPTTFNVNATTVWGQNVYVVGNISQLGNWNTNNAISLSASNYPIWNGTINLPPSTTIQYKYIKKDGNGNVIWESGSNRVYTTPASGTATRNDTWN